jgi:cysteine synthase
MLMTPACDTCLQEAAARTTALHEALGQLHIQLDELRSDHEDLQDAHRALVAKDLMRSGVLKDRSACRMAGAVAAGGDLAASGDLSPPTSSPYSLAMAAAPRAGRRCADAGHPARDVLKL